MKQCSRLYRYRIRIVAKRPVCKDFFTDLLTQIGGSSLKLSIPFIFLFTGYIASAQINKQPLRHPKKPTSSVLRSTKLRIRMFIQGYYQTSGHMRPVLHNQFKTAALHIADTVEMLLHHSSYPYDIVHAQKALLHTNGL